MLNDPQVAAAMHAYVLESAPVIALSLDRHLRVVDANAQARRFLGEAVLGRPFAAQLVDFNHGIDLASLVGQGGVVHRLTVSTAAGLPELVGFRFFPLAAGTLALGNLDFQDQVNLRDELLHLNQELSNLARQVHQANAELEQQVALRTAELSALYRELQGLLAAMPDAVLLYDQVSRQVRFHPPRREDRPAFLADAPDQPVDHYQNPLVLDLVAEVDRHMLAHRQTLVREYEREYAGHTIWLEVRATPIGPDRLLLLLRDITNRKRLEREERANLARERELAEMKSQLITVASHELRTPLTVALGTVGLLKQHGAKLTETKRLELLERVQVSLDRLKEIVVDFLLISRTDANQVTVRRTAIDLGKFVPEVIRETAEIDREQHQFVYQHEGATPPVSADSSLLRDILHKLVTGAARYSPPGTQVIVATQVSDQSFAVTVTDEGIGVPEAEREAIFKAFVRGSNVGTIPGLGLGLTIVQRYAELMGGRIELLPTERGASFRLRLPCGPAAG